MFKVKKPKKKFGMESLKSLAPTTPKIGIGAKLGLGKMSTGTKPSMGYKF